MKTQYGCVAFLIVGLPLVGCEAEKPPPPSLQEQIGALSSEPEAPMAAGEATDDEQAAAEPETPEFSRRLRAMDKDEDGKLTREEFQGGDEEFARIDIDGDGAITRQEANETRSLFAILLESLADFDTDGDRTLSIEEWDTVFKGLDADSGGSLDRDELRKAEGDTRAKLILEHFNHFDGAVRDGSITVADWGTAFARMDQLEIDGKATEEEIRNAVGRRGRGRRNRRDQ